MRGLRANEILWGCVTLACGAFLAWAACAPIADAKVRPAGDPHRERPPDTAVVDQRGNLVFPVVADALVIVPSAESEPLAVTSDGLPLGSRCTRSVLAAMANYEAPLSVICLPREFGLQHRMLGDNPPPAEGEHVQP